MKKVIVLLSLALLNGCGFKYNDEFNIMIHPSFGSKMGYVLDAASKWEEAVGVTLNTVIEVPQNCDAGNNICVFAADKDSIVDELKREPPEGTEWTGLTVRNNLGAANIYISNKVLIDYPLPSEQEENLYQLQATLPHEFGHAFGLDHDPHVGAVMCQNTQCGGTEITCWDKKQYFNLRDVEYSCE